jgi:hypothetical protein
MGYNLLALPVKERLQSDVVSIWSYHFEHCSPGVTLTCEFIFQELHGTFPIFKNCFELAIRDRAIRQLSCLFFIVHTMKFFDSWDGPITRNPATDISQTIWHFPMPISAGKSTI